MGALTRSSSASATTAAATTLVAASAGDFKQTVTTTGTMEPAHNEALTFRVSGTVTSVAATVRKKVVKGAVLATVDSTTLQTAVTTATAAVTAAEQQVTSVASSTSAQQAAARAQLASAATQLAQAQDDLAGASLTAPFTGVVAAVGYAVGDVVAASGPSAGSGGSGITSAITLITTDAWIVNATVGSSDLVQLKKGLQATITPSGSGTPVFGTIASLGIVATSITGGFATFPVVIDVTGSPAGLYAGATADVSLLVSSASNVLTVPTLALHTVNGETVVFQRISGKRVTTPVTIGTVYGASTQIKSGINAGDQVEVTFPGSTGGRRNGTTNNRTGGNQVPPGRGGFGGPGGFTNGGPPGGNG